MAKSDESAADNMLRASALLVFALPLAHAFAPVVASRAAVAVRAPRPAMLVEFAEPETINALMLNTLALAEEQESLEVVFDSLDFGAQVITLSVYAAVGYVLIQFIKFILPTVLKLGAFVALIEVLGIVPPP